MPRRNIFEILNKEYNIEREVAKIITLCESDCFQSPGEYSTVENIFDRFVLKDWKQRGTYLSCKEMRDDIGKYVNSKNLPDDEFYVLTLEYFANILHWVNHDLDYIHYKTNMRETDAFLFALENLDKILEYLNYKKVIINDEEKVILVPKNPEATAVAEISSEETAFAILKYNHALLKGDLEGKRSLLNCIYREYETLLNKPIENYKDFYTKTKQLYNNLHIRHNNKTKQNNKNLVINIDDKELENWYDELYQLILFCVLIKDNSERKVKIEEFLKHIKESKI